MQDVVEPSFGVVPPPRKTATHIGSESGLPFIDLGDGSALQLLQVDLNQGIWITRVRFDPGCTIARHYHTGSVFAVTLKGHWYYEEYPGDINGPGSYLFEPAGSVHTLTVDPGCAEAAEVWFAVHGANVTLDDQGNVTSVVDAQTVLTVYREMATAGGADLSELLVVA